MRCNICNKVLTPQEIKFDKRYKKFDPCSHCLDEINETFDDYVEEEDIVFEQEIPDDIDEETFRNFFS